MDFPEKEEVQARLALLAIDPRTVDAAGRADLENYLLAQPNDPAALARRAALQQRDGSPEPAIKTYEKIIADDPLYAPASRQLALLLAERSPDAVRTYELAGKAREFYPGDAEVAKMLGILSYRRGFYPLSLNLLTEAAAKRQDDGELMYYLGEADYQANQVEDCTAALERALRLTLPDDLADEAERTLARCRDKTAQ
jgi:tetratricopeptide (TPR) repeat protein